MMPRFLCLALVLVGLAGCSPTPRSGPGADEKENANDASAAKADKPEVRFVVLLKPASLEILNGQQVEPTVVLNWKMRSHWAKGADPEVSFSARVEPPSKGVTVTLARKKETPPPADKEVETPIPVSIGASETAPAGEYLVEITATIPGGDPRSATIKVTVPRRE
jgi:hypothetical protein